MEGKKTLMYRRANYDRWKTTQPEATLPGDAPTDSPDENEREAFLARWEELWTPGGLYIARCKRCGFDTFTYAAATVEKHDKACRASRRNEET